MEITDVNTLFGAYPSQHPDSDPEALVAAMKAQEVHWCLTLSTWGIFHHDAAGNTETMRACQAYDHLIPVATLNPVMYWGQEGRLEEITEDAFEMFRFFPHQQGWPLDFAPFALLLSKLAALPRMPIMVSIEKPGDVTQLARVIADYDHPVVMAGISPETLTETLALMRAFPQLYLETHALRAPYALPLLRDTVGIERVLFGSDAPGLSLAAALSYIRGSGLSEADQSAILSRNAQAIWQAGGE